MTSFKSLKQIADYLGISRTTLWRKLKHHQIDLPGGLIPPQKEHEIKVKLGCTPSKEIYGDDMEQNETL
jgi:hypothetical protein